MAKLRIESLAASNSPKDQPDHQPIAPGLDSAECEPEHSPGLVCRVEKARMDALRFSSDELFGTVARTPADLDLPDADISRELRGAGLLH